jgi:hypothetical protein
VSDNFGLILDILVIALLGATIFYAAILSRRLAQLRGDRGELQSAVRALAEAAAKAESSVKGLRNSADEAGGKLQKQIDRAQALRDELTFLVDAGEHLANRLEQAATQAGGERRHQGKAAEDVSGLAEEEKVAPANQSNSRREPAAKAEAKPAAKAEAKPAAKAEAKPETLPEPRKPAFRPDAKAQAKADPRAEQGRRAGGGKGRTGTDRSLIHAIESLR